jgi:rod shape-determining protein MreD
MNPYAAPLTGRLAILGFVVCIVQLAAVSQLTIFGAHADLVPLAVAMVGLLLGSLPAAVLGFACGFFVDCALIQTMGLSSLVYLTVGYGAGRLRELRDPQAAAIPAIVGGAATTIVTVGYSVMQFLLGTPITVTGLLVGQILVTILVNTLISLPVYAAVRRWLVPVMPDDPRRRRRRAQTTRLSPLSRA